MQNNTQSSNSSNNSKLNNTKKNTNTINNNSDNKNKINNNNNRNNGNNGNISKKNNIKSTNINNTIKTNSKQNDINTTKTITLTNIPANTLDNINTQSAKLNTPTELTELNASTNASTNSSTNASTNALIKSNATNTPNTSNALNVSKNEKNASTETISSNNEKDSLNTTTSSTDIIASNASNASNATNASTALKTTNTMLDSVVSNNINTHAKTNNIMNNLNKLAMNFLNHQVILRLYHFQTNIYGAHKASDEYLEKFALIMDKFLEIAQGIYGKITLKQYTLTGSSHTDVNIIKHLDGMIILLREKINDVLNNNSDLINIRDELVGNVEQLKYLLTFK